MAKQGYKETQMTTRQRSLAEWRRRNSPPGAREMKQIRESFRAFQQHRGQPTAKQFYTKTIITKTT